MRRTGSGRRTNAGLLSFTRFYSVLLGFTRFYSVLLGSTRFYSVYSVFFQPSKSKQTRDKWDEYKWDAQVQVDARMQVYSVLLGFTRFYSVLLGFTRFYSVYSVFFQPSFSDYSVLLGFTYDGSVLLGIALYYLTQTFTTY